MAKKNAAKMGSGAVAAGRAARDNPYVQRLIEDPELRENLRSALESARKAYGRMNGSGPSKVLDDKRMQRDLKSTADSLRNAADALRESPRRRKRRGRVLLLAMVSAGLAMALSEGLRNKVLDALFGAEEEFAYSGSTTNASTESAASQPVEAS